MNNLDKNYNGLLEKILTQGRLKGDRTGTGTISLFGTEIRHNMQEGFSLLTTKKMFLKGVGVELEWFLKGDTNIKYLVDRGVNIWNGDAYRNYCKMIDRSMQKLNYDGPTEMLSIASYTEKIKSDEGFAKKYGNLGPIYGHQWRHWGGDFTSADGMVTHLRMSSGLDQLAQAITTLKNDPNNRRILINSWNADEVQYMGLPPCHYGFQLYSVELTLKERNDWYIKNLHGIDRESHEDLDELFVPRRGLNLLWTQRSCDFFLGIPFNIASYGLLLEIISKQVGMMPMDLIGHLGDSHIYLNHIEQVKEQISRTPYLLPTLNLPAGVTVDNFKYDKEILCNYQSHEAIKAPLST